MISKGDQYIIEIGEVLEDGKLGKIKGFNSLVFDEEGLRRLDKLSNDEPVSADPVMLLPPEKGMIEKYVSMAAVLKRDITITLETDGRAEISMSIPTTYHTETVSKPSAEGSCDQCKYEDDDEAGPHCRACMHNYISHFERREKDDRPLF